MTGIRAARADDALFYARLFGELGLDEPVPPPERIAQLVPHMTVVEDAVGARGFAIAEVEGTLGYLRQIVVDPSARRGGLGRALCAAVHARLGAAGARAVRLNVKDDNAGAAALYRALGYRPEGGSDALWATHPIRRALPGSRAPLACFTPGPGDDADLERRFAMTAGQVAFHRARGELTAVRPAGARRPLLGFMRWVRSFPGAFPFHARSLDVARALLGDIEQRVPAIGRFGLVVDDDPALTRALLAAGAQLRFSLTKMVCAL